METAIIRKTFAELSKEEISTLKNVCTNDGAFRHIISNLEGGFINHPSKITISMLFSDDVMLGWLLLDEAKEYDELNKYGEISVMVYIDPNHRRKGLANKLFEFEINFLKNPDIYVRVYPDQKYRRFFEWIELKHNISLHFSNPVFYFNKSAA